MKQVRDKIEYENITNHKLIWKSIGSHAIYKIKSHTLYYIERKLIPIRVNVRIEMKRN